MAEEWQYKTEYYQSGGQQRKHRKKVYDACPICEGKKQIKSSLCADCRAQMQKVNNTIVDLKKRKGRGEKIEYKHEGEKLLRSLLG